MKQRIRQKIDSARGYIEDGGVLVQLPQVERKPPVPQFLIEESYLQSQVDNVLARLPRHKDWYTPREVAFAMSRSDRWVRDRFGKHPRCFNAGSKSKVYLSIPGDVVAEEVRKMFRSPMLRAS